MTQIEIATPLRGFFEQHLLAQRGLSGHTVLAYRDTLKLFLEFVGQRQRKTCTALTLADLTADRVRDFLDYLERVRKNSARSAGVSVFLKSLLAEKTSFIC
jgi:site-specific recombinase XerD